jgi:hypothetical protein
LPGEFILLTGCRRKSAVRLLRGKPVKEILLIVKEAVKLKPKKADCSFAKESDSIPMNSSPLSDWSGYFSGTSAGNPYPRL